MQHTTMEHAVVGLLKLSTIGRYNAASLNGSVAANAN